MKELILVKTGEIALKGLNKSTFEDSLVRNIRRRIKEYGEFKITKAQSTIYVEPKSEDTDLDEVCEALSKIFGISAYSRALITEKDIDIIQKDALEYLADTLPFTKTFKVNAKRADKKFPLKSPEIQQIMGGAILSRYPRLKVDVHNPELTVTVEIRETNAYIHAKVFQGAGGMPVGTSGKALLLVSGGIDSPVAGYMMAKRGISLSAIHYVSPPYTSERAQMKVEKLCQEVSEYAGNINFYCVPFTEIQLAIRDHCPEELFTIIMRRLMMKIALKVCDKYKLEALITGESVAQVASQTLPAIAATDAVCTRPVFRPCIGMDKLEIVSIARKIGTFETSIEPYEDCCTVFTPKHPKTRPHLEDVEAAEAAFDFEPLLQKAFEEMEIKMINPRGVVFDSTRGEQKAE